MPTRGTDFDHHIRQLFVNLPEETLYGFNLLTQPFSRGFGVVRADAQRFVVIDLDVFKLMDTQKIDYALVQIRLHLGQAQIPEPPVAHRDRHAVAPQHPVCPVKADGVAPHNF